MRAARLYRWGDVRVEELPVPQPGAGEALIRVDACGVCGTDALGWYVDRKAAAGPIVLGHEPVGTVVAVGGGVTAVAPGQRVFVHHHAPCLACPECSRGVWAACATWRRNGLRPGGLAEFAVVAADNLERDTLPLPDDLATDSAVFIEPLATCLRAVQRQGRLRPSQAVCIVGLGSMGLLLLQVARACGADPVIGTDFLSGRRELAVSLGADLALDPADGTAADAIRAATAGRGADLVIVCPGDARAIQAGIAAAAPGGRVVCFTPMPPATPLALDQSDLYFREITLTQSYSCGPDETRAALRLLRRGAIATEPLVTHRVGLDGVAAALERAKGAPDGIKTIVYPARAE
jgi:L-iditol 2-dehydrogenase